LGGQDYFCLDENVVNDGTELQEPWQNGSAEHPSDGEDI